MHGAMCHTCDMFILQCYLLFQGALKYTCKNVPFVSDILSSLKIIHAGHAVGITLCELRVAPLAPTAVYLV